MTEEKWKVLVESGERSRYEKIYRVEIDDRLMSTDDKLLIVTGPEKAATEVVALLQRQLNEAEGEAGAEIPRNGKSVIVSAETWLLFKEYDVLDTLESVYSVDFRATELPSKQVQLTLHGLYAEKVARMLADPPLQLDVPRVVGGWLTNEGPQGTRVKVIRLTSGALVKPSEDMTSVLLVGSSKATRTAQRIIGNIIVETVSVTDLQFEFLYGHDGEDQQQRPHHKLEDDTDTHFARDDGAGCLHVAGRPENVQEAVECIRKTQHIKPKTQRVSMAVGNYVATIRRHLENDDRQIHLQYDRLMYPRTCELRCLHRVDSEQDDPGPAHQKLMQELDLHEVVLDVHISWARFLLERCRDIQADEGVGISVSTALNERVLVNVAGSATTVQRGMDKVIKMITTDDRYRVGEIRLRRIEGQCVDTTGFEKVAPVTKEDLSDCEETFLWERLTSEQWRYAGPSSSKRKRKRSVKSKQHEVSENAKANNA